MCSATPTCSVLTVSTTASCTSGASSVSVAMHTPKSSRGTADSRHASVSAVLPGLFLGSSRGAADTLRLGQLGVQHIISVLDSLDVTPLPLMDAVAAKRLTLTRINAADRMDEPLSLHFPAVCAEIDAKRAAGQAVFVHCARGISRSPTLVAAYLLWACRKSDGTHLSARDVLQFLAGQRPCVQPNSGFEAQLDVWAATCARAVSSTRIPLDLHVNEVLTRRVTSVRDDEDIALDVTLGLDEGAALAEEAAFMEAVLQYQNGGMGADQKLAPDSPLKRTPMRLGVTVS